MKKIYFLVENLDQQGWNKNRELCMDVTTFLRSDKRMKEGKGYQGVLRRDVECEEYKYNERMVFVETVSQKREKRNPHVFEGEYITVTQRGDGTLRPNFRPMPTGKDFNVERYAAGVANELLWVLEGLVEEE